MTLDHLPRIALKVRGRGAQAISDASAGGLTPLASALSRAVDRLGYTDRQLSVALRNRLGLHDATVRRGKSGIGRITNRLLGEDPAYVEVPGAMLMQIAAADPATGALAGLDTSRTYLLRRDLADDIAARLAQEEGA